MFKSKLYLLITALSMLASIVGACAQPTIPETPEGDGTIIIYVTDASPEEEFTSIMVTLSEVQIHKDSATREQEIMSTNNETQAWEQEQKSQVEAGEWIAINISGNNMFDLLQIKGIEQFLGTTHVEAAKYTQVRLVIDTIQVKIGSANLTDVVLSSSELKIVQPFNVIAGETTALILDFEADKMVSSIKPAETVTLSRVDKIMIKPVVNLIVRQEKP